LYLLPGALKALMDTSTTDNAIVRAMKAPFDVKDALKARGYKWNDGVNGRPKHWSIELIDTNHPNELLFLEGLYKNAAISAVVEIKTSRVRFKKQ
jgi:DNA polymerase-3 subunit epsilon